MHKKLTLTGLALIAATLCSSCTTAPKNYADVGIQFYWNTQNRVDSYSNDVTPRYAPIKEDHLTFLLHLPYDAESKTDI
jgi:hypothetical protein